MLNHSLFTFPLFHFFAYEFSPILQTSTGIILTGGGALLDGVDQYLRNFVNLSVIVSDEPRYATVRGLLKMFDEPELLEKVSRTELHVLQNAEVSYEA